MPKSNSQARDRLPPQEAFFDPLLQVLIELEGEGTPREVCERVAQRMGLTDEQKAEMVPSGQSPAYRTFIHWARWKLVEAGDMHKGPRNLWRLSPAGVERARRLVAAARKTGEPTQVDLIEAFLGRLAPGYYHSQDLYEGLLVLHPERFQPTASRLTPHETVNARLNENKGSRFRGSKQQRGYFALPTETGDRHHEPGSARRQAEQLVNADANQDAGKAVVHLGGVEVVIEGEPRLIQHMGFERRRDIVESFKDRRFDETGGYRCEACDKDFYADYGELGRSCVEAHHDVPLSKRRKASSTSHADLSLLCATCHSLIHVLAGSSWISVAQLRQKLADAKGMAPLS